MTTPLSYFDLTQESNTDDFIVSLQNHFAVKVNPMRLVKRVFLDTFDWRLFSAGLQLERQTGDDEQLFNLQQS
ncbi:MAG: hypothetical protein AMJ53_03670, partial [Gammaproteobacteria bacterium SG8_11]